MFVEYRKLFILSGQALEVLVLCRMDEQERSLGRHEITSCSYPVITTLPEAAFDCG
jgi:hypothetical protein